MRAYLKPTEPHYSRLNEAIAVLGLPKKCSVCLLEGDHSDLLVCNSCPARFLFHTSCWNKWAGHNSSIPSSWEPCSRIKFIDWVWVNWLLYSNVPLAQLQDMCIYDIWSIWFNLPHHQDESDCPKLHLHPRMAHLVNMKRSNYIRYYPSLISFIGETGVGKSTIIRALIRNISPETKAYPVPVPIHDKNMREVLYHPDSIRLYADPETLSSEVPLFYAGMNVTWQL